MTRQATRRPYRTALIGDGQLRRHSYSTCERAARACMDDARIDSDLYLTEHRRYVVEFHTPEGPWIPVLILEVDGAGRQVLRATPIHERVAVG